MNKFICVHVNGRERLINTTWIMEILKVDGRAEFFLRGYSGDDSYVSDEAFEEVREMIFND